jgi:uncharacterized membrane protein YraQ (UPF0718 family)
MSAGIVLAHGGGVQSFLTNFDTMVWSALQRMVETVASAAPYLVVGLVFAGLLRGIVGPARLKSLLDAGPWRGPLRAWALGTLLPVCALGALPVARELRRARIPSGTVLTFLLAAPLFNPITLIYAISVVPLLTLFDFVCGTFVISVGIGGIWNTWINPTPSDPGTTPLDPLSVPLEQPAVRSTLRLIVVGETTARGLSKAILADCALVVLAMGLAGTFLPFGIFQVALARENPLSPLLTALVGVLLYVNPVEAVRVVGLTIHDGFSVGAAFSFLVIGAGSITAVVNSLRREFGWRRVGQFAGLLLLLTLAWAYAADLVLPRSTIAQSHTHAFDNLTRLSAAPHGLESLATIVEELWRRQPLDRRLGLWALGGLAVAGAILKLARVDSRRLMRTTGGDRQPVAEARWNRALTPTQLTVAGLVGLCAALVGGLYVYYPPPDSIVGDLDNARLDLDEAIRTKNQDEAEARIDEFRELAARLPVSVFLRKGSVVAAQRVRQGELIYSLDTLDEFVKEKQFGEAKAALRFVMDSYRTCREEYVMSGP